MIIVNVLNYDHVEQFLSSSAMSKAVADKQIAKSVKFISIELLNGSACQISQLPQQGQHQAVSYWLLCLVIVSASLPLPTSFMHML